MGLYSLRVLWSGSCINFETASKNKGYTGIAIFLLLSKIVAVLDCWYYMNAAVWLGVMCISCWVELVRVKHQNYEQLIIHDVVEFIKISRMNYSKYAIFVRTQKCLSTVRFTSVGKGWDGNITGWLEMAEH